MLKMSIQHSNFFWPEKFPSIEQYTCLSMLFRLKKQAFKQIAGTVSASSNKTSSRILKTISYNLFEKEKSFSREYSKPRAEKQPQGKTVAWY